MGGFIITTRYCVCVISDRHISSKTAVISRQWRRRFHVSLFYFILSKCWQPSLSSGTSELNLTVVTRRKIFSSETLSSSHSLSASWCCRALQQNPDTCLQMNISSQLKKAASKRTCFKNLLNRLTCDMSYNEVRLHFSRQCALCTRDQRGCLERNHS